MAEQKAASLRARVRAEMVDEIKHVARRHLAADGANLSLRAVARDLGMVSSAVYRYFASRDDLLTALILDAYNALGDAAERAEAAVPRGDLLGRWLAVAHGLRGWVLAHPEEYALIYGSPVPGYAAPQDTVEPSTRPVVLLGGILADAGRAGLLIDRGDPPLPAALAAEVRRIAEFTAAVDVPQDAMVRGLIAWTELFGALSFELFGRLNNTILERDAWFDHQVRAMAAYTGLR
ncbi:TetR family transcriptional regulator [Longispora fulva]|uniref:AcrR family transcriptional regulator n=1 Tax=Longispora fulva TaxID=619741 RepID=A0A8J7GPF3_9ACTN|nr:TetR/AcrR family transcriptional regulator [Longispora fulva]MBG6135493.1 AcrR family transcriptional regulator [Longispora fulva]GIG56267.1 TetR family transcriptional regulator [Longispora fulva]